MLTQERKQKLEILFNPRSIAVVGATNTLSKYGFIIPAGIINGGYEGKLYLINPRGQEILGHPNYPQVSAIPGEVDVALVITPAATVPKVIEDCGCKGVKADAILPPYWSRGNPVDLVATIGLSTYVDSLEVLVKDAAVDGVIAMGANVQFMTSNFLRSKKLAINEEQIQSMEDFASRAGNEQMSAITRAMCRSGKPILAVGWPIKLPVMEDGTRLVMFHNVERAGRALAAMVEYDRYRKSLRTHEHSEGKDQI